jgi:hypothetical protein
VERTVERHLGKIQADDPVIGVHGMVAEPIEHARSNPFITASCSVVSETACSRIASTLTQEQPVANRTRIPQKHSRSETRGR